MNLLLVSDDENTAKVISEKIVFLRKDDKITISSYNDSLRNIGLTESELILVHKHVSRQKTVDLIEKLKNLNLCVLLVANTYSEELILACADSGADDFIISSAEPFEFVVRIVNNIKHKTIKSKLDNNIQILTQNKVMDEGIYNYTSARQVIENVIDNNLIANGIFMAVTPASKSDFSMEDFIRCIKSSVRSDDIVTKGRGINFYIFMPYTDFNGAVTVLNKIKENLKFKICAGLADIFKKSFSEFEREALKALAESSAVSSDFTFAEEKDDSSFEELYENKNIKDYKLFRNIYNKKLEKVIIPVFYKLQNIYEEKLFETKIEQYANDNLCSFRIINKKKESELTIIYPGFSKVIINITHSGLDTPENRDINLPLPKVTQKELTKIIEDFIKEFKSN